MFAIPEQQTDLSEPVIRVSNLEKTVTTAQGSLAILESINLEIKRGESVAIVGASGSGKSTLLGLLAGLDVPSAGEVWLGDQDITRLDEEARAEVRGQWVGFVFQAFQLLPGLTALENVMLPLELKGSDQAEAKARDTLQQVGLGHRLSHYPKQLSGGEQQRVALARAFASEPAILFADEPTGNLDGKTGHQIESILFELNQAFSTTLVLVTHDVRLAERCDRQIHLDEGRVLS